MNFYLKNESGSANMSHLKYDNIFAFNHNTLLFYCVITLFYFISILTLSSVIFNECLSLTICLIHISSFLLVILSADA